MNRWKDIFGVALIFAGVAGVLGGVRGVSGGDGWGGPAIGAGVAVNALAYRVMRGPNPPPKSLKRGDETNVSESDA
jgi:hypothetical protein